MSLVLANRLPAARRSSEAGCLRSSPSAKVRAMGGLVAMSISCPDCAFHMPDVAAFCPGCGRSMQTAARADGMVGIFSENVAGALAYFTFIPAIIFLKRAPYNANRFTRFHSLQCLFWSLAVVIIGAALRLLAIVFDLIPLVGYFLTVVFSVLASLGAVVVWMVLVVKALQGETFKLPILGELAEQRSSVSQAGSASNC